jgi:N-acetylmuramoyl-L-alanine amidase
MRAGRGLSAVRVLGVSVLAILLFSLAPASSVPAARSSARVFDIRYWSSSGYTRVVIDLTRSTGFSINRLRTPERLYVDLYNAKLSYEKRNSIVVADGLLKNIRPAQFDDSTVRVVFDLSSIESYKVFRLSDPHRLVVDIFGDEVRREEREILKTYTVVIDPGHGGRDPGALGPRGIREKDVVLDVARKVKRLLEEEQGYNVILTRDRDVYLSLEDRAAIANQKSADLFISIHANANRNKRLRGLETYMLNWTDNEEAMEVAARENMISLKMMKEARSDVGVILASLDLQRNRDDSLYLANYIQDSMVSNLRHRYSRIYDQGVKQALFYVLFGAKMPSVLVEVSYITNRDEARRLNSRQYRRHLARGIASGIKTYIAKSKPVQEIAKR